MKTFMEVIEGFSAPDARSAFYYLGRYLKQAAHYSKYEKDFFEDDYQSKPSEEAKKLTLALINHIESQQNKKASQFTDEEYVFWVNQLDAVESKLDPEPTEEQVESARSVINDLFHTPNNS